MTCGAVSSAVCGVDVGFVVGADRVIGANLSPAQGRGENFGKARREGDKSAKRALHPGARTSTRRRSKRSTASTGRRHASY
jgi:hypothetical protein